MSKIWGCASSNKAELEVIKEIAEALSVKTNSIVRKQAQPLS